MQSGLAAAEPQRRFRRYCLDAASYDPTSLRLLPGVPPGRCGPGRSPRAGVAGEGRDPHGPTRHFRDLDRRDARRAGLVERHRDLHRLRVVPRRQHPAAGQDARLRDLRRAQLLRGIPRLGSRTVPDSRPPDGPRPDRHPDPGRLRHRADRHLQRPAAQLPVPGQPAGRPGRRAIERRRSVRGLVVGHDLGLDGPDHRRRASRSRSPCR